MSEPRGRPHRIMVYTAANCQACRMTKLLFDANAVRYTEIDITDNPKMAADLRAAGHCELPVVITNYEVWTGFRPAKIRGVTHGKA